MCRKERPADSLYRRDPRNGSTADRELVQWNVVLRTQDQTTARNAPTHGTLDTVYDNPTAQNTGEHTTPTKKKAREPEIIRNLDKNDPRPRGLRNYVTGKRCTAQYVGT